MSRLEVLLFKIVVATVIAAIGAGVLHWERGRLFTLGLGTTLLVLLFTVWERAHRAGTPFAFQEPLWFTVAVRIIPIGVALSVVQSAHRRGLPVGWQITLAVIAGVAANYVAIILLYLASGLV